MIHADALVKWYGPTLAVDHVSFTVEEGQIVGFLGPNGAGKSTTIRMLTGYLPASSGMATVGGHNVATASKEARAQIGYLPESTPLYPEMRVTEYLDYRGRLLGMSRSDRQKRMNEVIDRCGLEAMRRRTIGRLSKGNRQRVGLAQALLHDPPVLILDEPTAGLDPAQIGAFRTLVRELAQRHTILLSSHILPEIEKTADRVVMIAGGRKVAEGTLDEIRQQSASGGGVIVQARMASSTLSETLGTIEGVETVTARELGEGWSEATVTSDREIDHREAIATRLSQAGVLVRELRIEAPSLEAFFIEMTAAQRTSGVSAA